MTRELQVTKFICEIPGELYRFRVFETGNAQFYLFCALDPHGCDFGLHIPVKKSRLKKWVRRWIRANYAK